jgi:hypothetical protein
VASSSRGKVVAVASAAVGVVFTSATDVEEGGRRKEEGGGKARKAGRRKWEGTFCRRDRQMR